MLIDLLSNNNVVSYNTHVASIIGLHPAIYLAELLSINAKAINKDKTIENYFTLDRNYMQRRTTFDVEEQLDIENKLLELGILCKTDGDKNSMYLDVERLAALFMSSDEKLLKKVTVVAQKNHRSTKDERMIQALQSHIDCPNDELRDAYYDWITATYTKCGWMSKVAVEEAQKQVDKFSQRNLDVALKVVKIAAINGYRDINWAIEKYVKDGGEVPQQRKERKLTFGDDVF